MSLVFDRRRKGALGAGTHYPLPVRISRQEAWVLIGLGGSAIMAADWVTGQDVWFGPLYLLLIGFSAWCLGWCVAVGTAGLCVSATIWLNGTGLFLFGSTATQWNFAERIGFVALTIAIIESIRRAYARQWQLARKDPLTGALNRQAFFEVMSADNSSEWNMLVYVDIDGFKELNDDLGHDAGDACLREFAHRVRGGIRKGDLFARLGGDEFVIFMRVRDEAAGRAVALRLDVALNAATWEGGNALPCSIGALLIPPGERNVDRDIRQADTLMYQAKHGGASIVVAVAGLDIGMVDKVTAEGARAEFARITKTRRRARIAAEPRGGRLAA